MISYLEGRLLSREEDRLVVLTGGVGYEVLLPAITRRAFRGKKAGPEGEQVRLYVSYHLTERQPKPLLVGFESELEKEFFEKFITVEDIGPAAAIRAMTQPVAAIARAIEERDYGFLTQLDGIGPRRAEKIIASLHGKVGKFALMAAAALGPEEAEREDFRREVVEVLVQQLGHRLSEAQQMVREALARRPELQSAEELFEEVYRQKER